MPTFGQFFVATLAATITAASALPPNVDPRIGIPATTGSFEVKQVRNPSFTGHNGPLARKKALLKYGAPIPSDLDQAIENFKSILGLDRRDSGEVDAIPEPNDREYLEPVQIGTPPKTLALDFDTGSSDLWVFSSEQPRSQTSGHTVYDPSSSSSSSKRSGDSWSIRYGDGSSSNGEVYSDKVTIGGLTVDDQAVETAETVSSSFISETNLDGLLGLGFSNINTVRPNQAKTWFDEVKPQLDQPLFSVNLKAGETGSYLFGAIDKSAFNGELSYTPVDSSNGWWYFTSSGYAVGNGRVDSTRIEGIADTGTSLVLIDDSIAEDYYSQIPGAGYSSSYGGYLIPSDASAPDFTFAVGDDTITIPGEYMKYASIGNYAYGGLQSDSGLGFAIWGDVALKAAYVVFEDGSQPRLGWASKDL